MAAVQYPYNRLHLSRLGDNAVLTEIGKKYERPIEMFEGEDAVLGFLQRMKAGEVVVSVENCSHAHAPVRYGTHSSIKGWFHRCGIDNMIARSLYGLVGLE